MKLLVKKKILVSTVCLGYDDNARVDDDGEVPEVLVLGANVDEFGGDAPGREEEDHERAEEPGEQPDEDDGKAG